MKNSQTAKDQGKGRKIGDIYEAIDDVNNNLLENILAEDIGTLYQYSDERQEFPISYGCKVGNLSPVNIMLSHLDPNDEHSHSMLRKAFMNARLLGHPQMIATLRKKMFGWEAYSEPPKPQ